MVVLQSISFSNYALTTKTTNIIYGSAPYLTFDGGRTRVTNTEALLGISLSDGRRFTPTTNNSSSTNPIELPVVGQSFNDIGMLVPTDTNSIALSSLIGTPYNYWGDDDGDGQGVNGVTATGSLYLSIADKIGRTVARNEVPTICDNNKAPYKLTLSNSEGRLTTRYGVPNESRFGAGRAIYYIKPNQTPTVCYARLQVDWGRGLSNAVWNAYRGFLPQSFTPSSYGLNFPTTGSNNLYFDLIIAGTNQALSWAPVSHGGITATMTDSTSTSVRVTLTGPVVTDPNQWDSDNPDEIDKPSLSQVFELVGRDSRGNAVVKYGFELKQWFVSRGNAWGTNSSMESWCNKIGGYRMPKVRDLTNANCQGWCQSATPSSPDNEYRRHIGGGFFTEWGPVSHYTGSSFHITGGYYWTGEYDYMHSVFNAVYENTGAIVLAGGLNPPNGVRRAAGVCVYP
ncbi:hypothetical protein [Gilliamella apis]|uniref:Uncharacterized protein n=1 Tax=Gilliamella apis TaxID=1970738 RepID=A0A2C9XWC1_9GAMM|nr:hypothetical protein [Gilliamella apis]OTQ53070.1 hypothetical protein B6D06_01560 [Gilliamella apis]